MMDLMSDREALQSVDLNAGSERWALMALDPSGSRQLMVKKLGSGYQSSAVLFREYGGDRLSVLKWNITAHVDARMQRLDREARVARRLARSDRTDRFARLLSSEDLEGGYRQSWWEYYNLGSMRDFSMFVLQQANPPLSLVFRIVGQCLEGIQGMNQIDIFHMDLHTGNVFLHLDDGESYLDAVIGDFGYSRLPGEGPPDFTSLEWLRLSPKDRAGRSSPPPTYGDRPDSDNGSWRPAWDLQKFRFNTAEDLLDNLDKDNERNELVFALFHRMFIMCGQDEIDRKLPEAERPAIQDLSETIQEAKTLERLYAATTSDKFAVSELREKLLELMSQEPLEPLVFDNQQAAREKFREYLKVGLFRLVNLDDEDSVEAATAELAALKVEGSAYVSDCDRRSSSSSHDGTSPDSSETRESTPGGDSEQQDPERDSSERRSPPTSSRPSTRWSPATRGLTEATAFASGDASAVDDLLGARDLAERDQALVRAHHARRYRGQYLRGLFRRR